MFTSTGIATAIAENSLVSRDTVVYDATADADTGVTYTLKTSGDGSVFAIHATTGAVTVSTAVYDSATGGIPDFELQDSYTFTVVATDAAGNTAEQDVTLAITNVDDSAPTFVSGSFGATVAETVAIGSVLYTASADDGADISTGVTYSL